jgi:hypothetical protein
MCATSVPSRFKTLFFGGQWVDEYLWVRLVRKAMELGVHTIPKHTRFIDPTKNPKIKLLEAVREWTQKGCADLEYSAMDAQLDKIKKGLAKLSNEDLKKTGDAPLKIPGCAHSRTRLLLHFIRTRCSLLTTQYQLDQQYLTATTCPACDVAGSIRAP